ncbi:imidazole glycerol phosphate synthase subunit HisH [Oscillibacter sp. MSJ-2]|uniref:Imidazole glycerol phosphate synthase subunit HisH n=1 Tax=Dysosmobacter acutus TaxID=2841504 RepID=A0ABS6FBM6_9FIRM|nr:imidazole glycerol phosphate synthase subunit HisH [Dysosmobacter acutus]MBU5627493.1 imidazole glycerol phosphate synthase subunit HisH [Dysosmobacter acutus]
MTAIVDYGVGNLFSLTSSLRHLGVETEVTREEEKLRRADRIILPGVGAFGDAKDKLEETGLIPLLREEAGKKPFLGICLGMQLLLERSYEYGVHGGLGLIGGEVVSLRETLRDPAWKVPHMGWNSLRFLRGEDPLLREVDEGEYVYYVHSFYAAHCGESTVADSEYGAVRVPGIVRRGSVWGCQFHPEKSGDTGLRILKAFTAL